MILISQENAHTFEQNQQLLINNSEIQTTVVVSVNLIFLGI